MNKTESEKYLLSFCIPTYNRPKEFERMLTGVLPQITKEVEIVIRDDSTNDETKKIFDRLIGGKDINFRYIRGEKIGLDAACLFLIENASGNYIWWFSDDDELRAGAISHVLEIIKNFPETYFIWANFDFQTSGNPAVNRDEGFFKDRNDVLESLGTGIGFVSSLIFDKERLPRHCHS